MNGIMHAYRLLKRLTVVLALVLLCVARVYAAGVEEKKDPVLPSPATSVTEEVGVTPRGAEPDDLTVEQVRMIDENGNGRIEPTEIVALTVRVQNRGTGEAKNVTANIQPGWHVFMAGDGNTFFDLGSLKPGQSGDIQFVVYTNKQLKNGDKMPIKINLSVEEPPFSTTRLLFP